MGKETTWHEVRKQKTIERNKRREKKEAKMQKRFNDLVVMEHGAIADGRSFFNTDELYSMLYPAYLEARKNKRGTYDVQRFEANLYDNLYRLAGDIAGRRYRPSRSEAFVIFKPVMREIFAAAFRERVVHHLLIDICMPWWHQQFSRDSYSCRVGKGTDYGVRRAAHHIAVKSDNYRKRTFFVKLDIKGFFMSMDRNQLLSLTVDGVHREFCDYGPLAHLAAFLWKQIILDDPLDGVKIRGDIADWDSLPRDKSLFFQRPGRGIVIGNLTSQLLSNILLNSLDRFIVHQLGFNHYGRYVDDFYIVVNDTELEYVHECLPRIRDYLATLGLTLHPKKTKFLDVTYGVPYLGHVIMNGHIEKDRRYVDNYQRTMLKFTSGLCDLDSVVSYMGGCVNYGCHKMQEHIWDISGQKFL